MEGKTARIARYAVLAVFLCLTLGPAGLMLANLPPGIRLEDAGIIGILLIFLLFSALSAWEAFHQCRRQGLLTGAVLLLIASVALPGLAAVHDSFQEPEDRAGAPIAAVPGALLVVGGLWAVAAIGAVPAVREQRRRLTRASAE